MFKKERKQNTAKTRLVDMFQVQMSSHNSMEIWNTQFSLFERAFANCFQSIVNCVPLSLMHSVTRFAMEATVIIPANKVERSRSLTDKLETLLPFYICGSPYPRMDGRKIASLLQEGKRMPKPQHVDDKL